MASKDLSAASPIDLGRPLEGLAFGKLYADTESGVMHLSGPTLRVCDQVWDGLQEQASRDRLGLKDEVHDRQLRGSARPSVT